MQCPLSHCRWLIWLYHLSIFAWALRSLSQNEFYSSDFSGLVPTDPAEVLRLKQFLAQQARRHCHHPPPLTARVSQCTSITVSSSLASRLALLMQRTQYPVHCSLPALNVSVPNVLAESGMLCGGLSPFSRD